MYVQSEIVHTWSRYIPVQRQLGIVDSDVVSKLLQAVEGSPSDSGVNFVRFQIVE